MSTSDNTPIKSHSKSANDPLNLDGRRFAMVSSTSSVVDQDSPTTFDYHERDSLVWGEYVGDTVRHGRFVGSRQDHSVSIAFTHVVAATGAVVSGAANSLIEESERDGVRLIEKFDTAEGEQVSVCREVSAERH